MRVEAIRSTDSEEDALSAAAARLAMELGRAWLARPWGAGRVDRSTIEAFHKAAVDGDSERVGTMLSEAGRFGAPTLLESRNSAGWTPLMWASWHAKVPVMRRLVQAKCNVNASDRYGQSALSLAAESTSSCQEAAVTLLLDAGADTAQKGYEGKTPAEWAEETGNPRLAAHIRRAPTRRGRWMAAEQRLALAKLLQRRLGKRSPVYPVVNRDVMEVIARWMPYTKRRELCFGAVAVGDHLSDRRSELEKPSEAVGATLSSQGAVRTGLRRRRRQQLPLEALDRNGDAQHVGSTGDAAAGTRSGVEMRMGNRGHDDSDDDDEDERCSEVLDRYLECVDTLIERHDHQPWSCESITVRVEPRRDGARALHPNRDDSEREKPRPSAGTEWSQLSIRCAHCALRCTSAAKAGLNQPSLQQHCRQVQNGCSYADLVIMLSPAPVRTTEAPDGNRADDGARSQSNDVELLSLPGSPRSPRRLPPRLEYDSVVARAPAQSCMSSLFDAVGKQFDRMVGGASIKC